jgi:hypothetical protein
MADLVREMKDAYNHRLRLVQSARQMGIKPTARLFSTTVPTVRKWLRRFQQGPQSPWQIIERLNPRSPLELCLLPPVFLDYYLNDSGGYDVPRLPYP